MKKLLFTLFALSTLAACNPVLAQIQNEFPKKCLHIKTTPKKANVYSAISVTTSTASISGVTVPIALTEYQYTSSGLSNVGQVSAGVAYVWGAANLKISNDSTPILSGITYYGGAVLYRTDAMGKHYIPGLIVGFNDFALQLGVDYVPTPVIPSSSKVYAEVSITANLMNLPLINNLFSIKTQ